MGEQKEFLFYFSIRGAIEIKCKAESEIAALDLAYCLATAYLTEKILGNAPADDVVHYFTVDAALPGVKLKET